MKAYSFLNTVVVVNGAPIVGWADGDDVIQIKRRNDAASDKVGADGRMAVAISADKSGEFTFKLMQTSPSNKILNNLAAAQGNGPTTFVPASVLFQDTYRQDRGSGTVGYVKRPADLQRGAGINDVEWTIVVERMDLLLGDPGFAGLPTQIAENI